MINIVGLGDDAEEEIRQIWFEKTGEDNNLFEFRFVYCLLSFENGAGNWLGSTVRLFAFKKISFGENDGE